MDHISATKTLSKALHSVVSRAGAALSRRGSSREPKREGDLYEHDELVEVKISVAVRIVGPK